MSLIEEKSEEIRDNLINTISNPNSNISFEPSLSMSSTPFPRKSLIEKGGSLITGIISLSSINFDTSSLSFPIALYYTGLVPGTLMLFIISFLSYWTTKMLLISGVKQNIYSYPKLIEYCLGKKMRMLFNINNTILTIGAQCQYIMTISLFFSELMLYIFNIHIDERSKAIQMCLCMIFIQIPLTMQKNLSKLKYASFATCFVVCFALVLITIEAPFFNKIGKEEGRSSIYLRSLNWNYLDSFSIFIYSFCPHNGLFLVVNELKRHDLQICNKLILSSSLLLVLLFVITGYSGFFSLIEDVPVIFISRPNLGNPYSDTLMIFVKILFFISLNLMCAINFNLVKTSLNSLLFKEDVTSCQSFIIISIFYICSNVISFIFKDVVQIIGVISGISVTFICYVFPILCYVKSNGLKRWHIFNFMSIFIISVITAVGFCSTSKNIIELFSNID